MAKPRSWVETSAIVLTSSGVLAMLCSSTLGSLTPTRGEFDIGPAAVEFAAFAGGALAMILGCLMFLVPALLQWPRAPYWVTPFIGITLAVRGWMRANNRDPFDTTAGTHGLLLIGSGVVGFLFGILLLIRQRQFLAKQKSEATANSR